METLPSFLQDAKTVLIVTGVLGLLSLGARFVPGKAGEIVRWVIDLFSANIKHDNK